MGCYLVKIFAIVAATSALGCGGGAPPPTPHSPPHASTERVSPGEYLLFEPTAQARDLLGKAVVFDDDGAFRVAPHRKPGCRVEVITSPDAWQREFGSDVGSFVSAGGGIKGLAELSARRQTQAVTTMKINNQKVLRARLRGPCGPQVITTVKVGTGQRSIYEAEKSGGSASFGIPSSDAEAQALGYKKLSFDLSWQTPQAWGFELGGEEAKEGVTLEASLYPTTLRDGDPYTIQVKSNKPVWLVIIFQEEESAGGAAGVAVPAMQGQRIHRVNLRPEETFRLPEGRAFLNDPSKAQRDTIFIYALRHKTDMEALNLAFGQSPAEDTAQAHRVMREIEALPPHTFTRRVLGYSITPKEQP